MTNAQLYMSIAIPSVLVILSWVLVALSWMQQDKRLARIEFLIDGMRSEMISLRDSIHRDMVPLHERMATVEARQRP